MYLLHNSFCMRCLPHAKVCYTQRNASKCIKNTSECCGRKRHSIREKTTLIPVIDGQISEKCIRHCHCKNAPHKYPPITCAMVLPQLGGSPQPWGSFAMGYSRPSRACTPLRMAILDPSRRSQRGCERRCGRRSRHLRGSEGTSKNVVYPSEERPAGPKRPQRTPL